MDFVTRSTTAFGLLIIYCYCLIVTVIADQPSGTDHAQSLDSINQYIQEQIRLQFEQKQNEMNREVNDLKGVIIDILTSQEAFHNAIKSTMFGLQTNRIQLESRIVKLEQTVTDNQVKQKELKSNFTELKADFKSLKDVYRNTSKTAVDQSENGQNSDSNARSVSRAISNSVMRLENDFNRIYSKINTLNERVKVFENEGKAVNEENQVKFSKTSSELADIRRHMARQENTILQLERSTTSASRNVTSLLLDTVTTLHLNLTKLQSKQSTDSQNLDKIQTGLNDLNLTSLISLRKKLQDIDATILIGHLDDVKNNEIPELQQAVDVLRAQVVELKKLPTHIQGVDDMVTDARLKMMNRRIRSHDKILRRLEALPDMIQEATTTLRAKVDKDTLDDILNKRDQLRINETRNGPPCNCTPVSGENSQAYTRQQLTEVNQRLGVLENTQTNIEKALAEFTDAQTRTGEKGTKERIPVVTTLEDPCPANYSGRTRILLPKGEGGETYGDCLRGYLTIQHRIHPFKMNMSRSWQQYKFGFREEHGENVELWLGLEYVHQLTSHSSYELRIEVRNSAWQPNWVQYSIVMVGPESDMYRLSVAGDYFGSMGDTLRCGPRPANGVRFSTFDVDNDGWSGENCASKSRYSAGWWYTNCFATNLNTNIRYIDYWGNKIQNGTHIQYYDCGRKWYGYLKETSIMIKKH